MIEEIKIDFKYKLKNKNMATTKKEKQLKQDIDRLEKSNIRLSHEGDRQRREMDLIKNHLRSESESKNLLIEMNKDYIEAFKHHRRMEEKNFDAMLMAVEMGMKTVQSMFEAINSKNNIDVNNKPQI